MTYHRPGPIILPGPLQSGLAAALRAWLEADGTPRYDFSSPPGEPALVARDSVSWRLFKNPLALFIGGVAAVILELAEPRVRTGVWEHTSFGDDPVRRLQRTGLAAIVTVYGARSRAEAMIAGVRRLHEKVAGTTPAGEAYRASDPELLRWVYATAAYGFLQAYHAFVRRLTQSERDRYYAEGVEVAALYGAAGTPRSEVELATLFGTMRERLQRSPIVGEFLSIMRSAPILPLPLRPVQHLLIRAAVEVVPRDLRALFELDDAGLRSWEHAIVRQAGAFADRIVLDSCPAVQACRRLGLPADYLYAPQAWRRSG